MIVSKDEPYFWIFLIENNIGNKGAKSFSNVIKINKQTLLDLRLNYNNMDYE